MAYKFFPDRGWHLTHESHILYGYIGHSEMYIGPRNTAKGVTGDEDMQLPRNWEQV